MEQQGLSDLTSHGDSTVLNSAVQADPNHSTGLDKTADPESEIEKRREVRYLCCDPAEVRALGGQATYLPATVIDISRSGMRLEVAICLFRGQEIEIKLQAKAIILGEVRYSRSVKEAFHIGVRIVDVFYSRRPYMSDHLHEDQLLLYIGGKGLNATEVLGVRDHLRLCKDCSEQYSHAVKLTKRLRHGASEL